MLRNNAVAFLLCYGVDALRPESSAADQERGRATDSETNRDSSGLRGCFGEGESIGRATILELSIESRTAVRGARRSADCQEHGSIAVHRFCVEARYVSDPDVQGQAAGLGTHESLRYSGAGCEQSDKRRDAFDDAVSAGRAVSHEGAPRDAGSSCLRADSG